MASFTRTLRLSESLASRELLAPAARFWAMVRPRLVISTASPCCCWCRRKSPTSPTASTTRQVMSRLSLSFRETRSVRPDVFPGKALAGLHAMSLMSFSRRRPPPRRLGPERPRGEVGALPESPELGPHHAFLDELGAGEGSETAIRAGQDARAIPHRRHGRPDAVGHHLRVLDHVDGGVDHPRYQEHAVGERMAAKRLQLVLV